MQITHSHTPTKQRHPSTRPPIPVQRGILNQPSSYHEPEHPPGENETPASTKARAYRRPHSDRLWLLLGVGVQPKQQSAPRVLTRRRTSVWMLRLLLGGDEAAGRKCHDIAAPGARNGGVGACARRR